MLRARRRKRLEGIAERVPTVDCRRRLPVRKPTEKHQVLRMVSKSVQRLIKGNPRKRIANFQIVLTSAYLAHIAPRWSRIVDQRIIHPLTDLVTKCVDITNAG